MNLTPKHNKKDFNRFLFDQIDLDSYRLKYLNEYLDRVIVGQLPLYDLSIINISDQGWILILHGEVLLVYGQNWTQNQLQEISEIFDLNKFTNFSLVGDNDLIEEIIKFYKPRNFDIEKRRLFYKASEIQHFENKELKIRLGRQAQSNELAFMLQEYYYEEYNGKNNKIIEEMQERIQTLILSEKIYVLLDMKDELVSFCSIINPDIGILFTKRNHRNLGYGKIILSYCSNILQQRNQIVYLMTDRDKIESNIVCQKVGFIPYYEYVMTKINCD